LPFKKQDKDNYLILKSTMQSFTTEDLLQYLYKETSTEKTNGIKEALESDWALREKFEVMLAATKRLDALTFSPRQESIDKILNYAEKAVEEFTPHA
jgi:hypothetical protein